MILLTFQLKIVCRLLDESFSKGGQFDHSCEDKKIAECNTRPSFPLGAESLSSQRRIKLKLNTLKIPLAPTSQQGSFQVMIVGTHHIQKQKESKTFERKSQNATKNNVGSRRLMHSISLASDVDFDEDIVSVSGSHEPFV